MEKNIIEIKGEELECPHCGNNEFFELESTALYPKKGIAGNFFGSRPKVYVCSSCGLKQEFILK